MTKREKRELKLSSNPLRQLRADLRSQGTTLEEFLEVCYNCGLNPLPMLRVKGINVKYFKNTSYCDVSVSHDERDRVVLSYPDYGSDWDMWTRFNDRYHELIDIVEERKIKRGLNRPHRVVMKSRY